MDVTNPFYEEYFRRIFSHRKLIIVAWDMHFGMHQRASQVIVSRTSKGPFDLDL